MKKLIDVMNVLRGPDGCPWDKKQTIESLMSCLLEETYEIIDAVMSKKYDKAKEEIGDMLCIVAMIVAIARERNYFTYADVEKSAITKMKRRHPHVFGTAQAKTSHQAHHLWHAAKKKEKSIQKRRSVLDDISLSQPALMRADKISRRVARVGFDWPSMKGVLAKVDEELAEFKKEVRQKKSRTYLKEELGDFLFSIVNMARKLQINPEVALTKTNCKFIQRFHYIENELKKKGKRCADVSLAEMDALWEQKKRLRKRKKK